jgi:hypothetical protein
MVTLMLLSLAAALLPLLGIFPSAPTVTTFQGRDFGGKPAGDAVVWSMEGRLRLQVAGRIFVYDGREWFGGRPASQEDSAAVAFLAPFEAGVRVARADAAGRPLAIVDVPAGTGRARVEYHYDAGGLAAASVVFADGSGVRFRRIAVEAGSFAPSDFDPPKSVTPPPASGARAVAPRVADRAAVERLFAISIPESEQLAFEREGGIGRFRPTVRR